MGLGDRDEVVRNIQFGVVVLSRKGAPSSRPSFKNVMPRALGYYTGAEFPPFTAGLTTRIMD